MAKIEIDLPEALSRRMQAHADVDWAEVARRAFDACLEGTRMHGNGQNRSSYEIGYNWARSRADLPDLVAMVEAPNYALAAAIVRGTKGFSQRDEFGDALHPSDEMWESFVDGATALYNDVTSRLGDGDA